MPIIRTVCGDIAPEELGYTSVHEHTLFQPGVLRKALLFSGPDTMRGINGYEGGADIKREAERRAGMDIVEMPKASVTGVLVSMRFPRSNPASRLSDMEYYTNELKAFHDAGGHALCDCSPLPTGRPLKEIAALSKRSGIHILACAGFYIKASIPKKLLKSGKTGMIHQLEVYLEQGDGSGDERPGFLKCAVSALKDGAICPEETMAVDACAETAKKYGMSLHIHTQFPVRQVHILTLAEHLKNEIEIDPAKVIFCHMDSYALGNGNPTAIIGRSGYDAEFPKKLMDMGFHIGLDTWGIGKASDLENEFGIRARYQMLSELLAAGYASQITLGHDFMAKSGGVQNGGMGYTAFPVFLAEKAKTDPLIRLYLHTLTVDNPAKLLSF